MFYHKRTNVDINNIRPLGVCDRCGFTYFHDELRWQYDYVGGRLVNKNILVCPECLDDPFTPGKKIVLPPDPVPVLHARIDRDFTTSGTDEDTSGSVITTEEGTVLVTEDEEVIWVE